MPFYINEPIASQRIVPVYITDNSGVGYAGLVAAGGYTIKIAKHGGNWVAPGASTALTEVTGGPNGTYRLAFDAADWDTVGVLEYSIVKTGTIRDFMDGFVVEPLRDALVYCLSQGGSTSTVRLNSTASSTDDYYSSLTSPSTVEIIAGTGAGQSRVSTGYTGSSRTMAVSPNWKTAPDSTSILRVLPISGSGSGGGGSVDAAAVALAILNTVIDANAPANAQTVKHVLNLTASYVAGPGTGYPQNMSQQLTLKSLGGDKTRLAGTVSGGARTVDTADGS